MRGKYWIVGILAVLAFMLMWCAGAAQAKNENPPSLEIAQHEVTPTPPEGAPPAAAVTEAQTSGSVNEKKPFDGKAWLYIISALASALGIGIATIGPGIGQGSAVARAMEAIGRNPESQGKVMLTLLIGLAFIESLVLYALIVSLVLLFGDPFGKFFH